MTDEKAESISMLDRDAQGDGSASGTRPAAPAKLRRRSTSIFARGEPMIWLTGGSLMVCVVMIVGLLVLILSFGMSTFWPGPVTKLETFDGKVYMGEITRTDSYEIDEELLARLNPEELERVRGERGLEDMLSQRRLVRTGNFRLTQTHFQWVNDYNVARETAPEWALVIERLEWGIFYGFPEAFVLVVKSIEKLDEQDRPKSPEAIKEEARRLLAELSPRHGGEMRIMIRAFGDEGDQPRLVLEDGLDTAQEILGIAERISGTEAAWSLFNRFHGEVRDRWKKRRGLEKDDTGDINAVQEKARLAMREAALDLKDAEEEFGRDSEDHEKALVRYDRMKRNYEEKREWASEAFGRIRGRINEINGQNSRYLLEMQTSGESDTPPRRVFLRLDEIVHAYPANQLSFMERTGVYLSRWWEYLTDEPREANSEGGVFPAIFGTVLMTLMMALAVVPFGVLAALYLREYAKAGPVVSAVRIAVNNLAGVPSIVFGVFGLGFFCYGLGSFIDGGPGWVMPKLGWFILLGVAAVAGTIAFLCFLGGMTRPGQGVTPRQRTFKMLSLGLWLACALTVVVLVATTPFFDGFYRSRLPNPTFGKGALIWASFTLALLTLPVVIVATEEALSAVPNSMREGSYACGASKWQTIRRIVMPRAMPGIMTGMILAMARGAGEVAPLMLVGAVKLAPELPFDLGNPGEAFGLNRSFMHLGFHIYDVGFQSQNSEAAKPMVYTTTFLLILIVAILNISAIWLRSRLKKRFVESHF
jgi:ABC-type phosphate transport system permease subunit/ABC-type phosphate transport system auxiliary subunit